MESKLDNYTLVNAVDGKMVVWNFVARFLFISIYIKNPYSPDVMPIRRMGPIFRHSVNTYVHYIRV